MSDLNFLDTSGNKQTITVPAVNSMAFNTANTERLRISGIGSFGFGTSDPHRKVDVIGNSLVVRPTTSLDGASGNANAVNNSIIARMPYGQNAGSSNNAGARVGIQFTGATDPNSNNWGYVNDPLKSASIYGVSEDTSAGYSRRMALAFYTSGFDIAQSEKMRISSDGFVIKPNNPAFRATREGSEATQSAQAIQQWNTVSGANRSFDRYTTGGYGFNTSTYKYKVPVTGVWYFHASVYTNTGYSCMFDIRTSSQILQRAEDNSGSNMPNNNIVHASCVVTCSRDDEVYVNTSGGQSKLIAGTGYISFDGYFIG